MRSLGVFVAVVIAAFAGGVVAQGSFPDVPPGHWAAAAVQRLIGWGIVLGFPDGQFHGDRTLTRYEEATALDRALTKVREWIAAVPAGPTGPPGPPGPQGAPGAGAAVGTIQGTVIGLPQLVILRFAQGSAMQVPITWGTCMTFYACREPFFVFMNGAVGDELRIGSHIPFARLWLDLLGFGAGGQYVAEYYNGSAWAGLSGLNDGTVNMTRAGWVAFTVPSSWPASSIESSLKLHWIRLRATAAWTGKPFVRLIGVPVADALLRFRGAALWTTTTDAVGNYGPSPELPAGAYVVDFSASGWVDIQYLVPVQPGLSSWIIGPQGR